MIPGASLALTSRSRVRLLLALLGLSGCVVVISLQVWRPLADVYLAAALGAVVCFVFWRQAIYGVFIAVLLEGYFRNLLNTPNVLLIKDAMIAIILVRLLADRIMHRERLVPRSPINVPLAVFAALCVAQSLNPQMLSVNQALVGLRTWLYYVALYYIGAEMIKEDSDRRRFLWFMLLTGVLVSVIGVLQLIAGPDAYSRLGPGFRQATFVTTTGPNSQPVYRPNSTFAWSSHFAIYLAGVTLMCTGAVGASRGRSRVLLLLLFGGFLAVNVVEGQRTLVVLLPFLILSVFLSVRKWKQAIGVAAAGVAIAAIAISLVGSTQNGRLTSLDRQVGVITNADGILTEQSTYVFAQIAGTVKSVPLGQGTGASANGSRYVNGSIPLFLEVSLAKAVADLGVVGAVAYLGLFGALMMSTVSLQRAARNQGRLPDAYYAAALLAYQFLVLFSGYDLAAAAIPFWFLSGTLVSLRTMRATEKTLRLAS